VARDEKVEKVRELTRRFRDAAGVVFAEFRGLTVKDATELRRFLRGSDTGFSVVKNTLTRLALREVGHQEALDLLDGPTAVAFISGDPVSGAKAVLEATRRFPAVSVKGALIEGRLLGAEEARALATVESREVSLGKLAGTLTAPVGRMTYLLRAPLQRIAFALAERARRET
jgi:large subunit ribosomal protein L10